ncbi:MAG: TIGR01212 family radical SAM protein [Fusobacteriaceae bacterium]
MSSRYYSLSECLVDKFEHKTYKVSLDAGMNCPNRDGKLGRGGCIFCSDSGSGEFTADRRQTIYNQIEDQLQFISRKFPTGKVIAYFQNFTNTYGDPKYLREVFYEALSHPRVVGIAIATRPDCLGEEILDLLEEISKKHFIWIELGLQSWDDYVASKINRGYSRDVYSESCKNLKKRGIKFVTHIIVGLPYGDENDSLETAKFAVKCGTWGIKIHSLYVMKNSRLEREFRENSYHSISLETYVQRVADILENIPKNIVIHRLTGDCDKNELLEPLWSGNKINVLNSIEKELKRRGSYQGKKLEE